MRLTLRTLLAYLDDVLDPAQTREIGQKIRESPRAAALISRIREVIRRRRLGAPELSGPAQGLDPNLVAEYLDNVLTPEQVVEVERVCLESDLQLAEVAACHQILTLVLAETPEVAPTRLERFYALGPVAPEDRLETKEPSEAAKAAPAPQPAALAEESEEFVPRLPDYLKPAPWSQRVAPTAGIALIALLGIGLLVMDRDLFRGLRNASSGSTADVLSSDQAPQASPALPRPPSATREVTVAAAPQPARAPSLKSLPPGIDPPPPPDLPETPVTTPPTPSVKPVPEVVATPATSPPRTTEATVTPPVEGQVPSAPETATPVPLPDPLAPRVRVPIHYISTEGILLRYEPGEAHWYVLPRRSELHAEETFACPEPFEAQLDVDRGAFKISVLSDTLIDILPGSDAARQGVRLRRGRLVLQGGAGDSPERRLFVVQTGSQSWRLMFAAPQTVCGIEVHWREPVGLETVFPGDQGLMAALTVETGTIQVESGNGPAQTYQPGQRHILIGPGTDAWPSAETWLNPQRRQATETLRRFGARFEREFDPMLAIDLTIPALTKDPHPKISELATRCLGLLGHLSGLVQALAESEHEESRSAATRGLRLWLGQNREYASLVREELRKRYSDADAEVVYRLLWGLTPMEGKDKILSAQLVELLNHNRVEIRELAFEQMVKLTGRKYEYLPLSSPTRRAPAVQRWRGHLEREGGALIRPD